MPQLRSTQDLLRALGSVAGASDPIGELKRKGFTLSPALIKAIGKTRPSIAVSDATRQRAARIAAKTKVTVHAGGNSLPAVALRFTPDDYDVIAAVNTSLVDQVLNGLHQTNTIPQLIPFERLLTLAQRSQLAKALSGVFTNIPSDAVAGTLSLVGPLSTRALDGTDALLLSVPFTVEILQLTPLRTVAGVVAGTLSLVVALSADVAFLGNPEVAAIRISVRLPAFPAEGVPSLAIDPASLIQPQRPEQLPSLALILQNLLGGIISQAFEVSPFINIPGVPGLRLVVERIDVRSVTAVAGDRIAVGVRFIGAGATPPDLGRLASLVPEGDRNIALRVQERFLDAALDNARRNGALDAIARKENDSARVTSADARFSNNQIILTLRLKVIDACATLDVGVTVTQTLTLIVDKDQLTVESFSDPDVDNVDTVLCAILAFVVGLALSLPALLVAPFIGVFQALFIAAGLLDFPEASSSSNLFPLNKPVPGTELLPVIERFIARVEDGTLIASAAASFRPDDINTYIYVRFLNTLNRFDSGVPLSGARVEVRDQDAPPPAGDDVVIPKESETERVVGNKFIRTVTVSYERPSTDPLIGQGTTNFDGRVMFVLAPGQLANGAGRVVTTTTIEDIHAHTSESTTTSRNVAERAPDVYFRIFAVGDQEDTKNKPAGLTMNLRSKHLGTPGVPLQFSVSLTPGIAIF